MAAPGNEAAMLTVLLATCETSLQAFKAADNPIDAHLIADLERVIVRTRSELAALGNSQFSG
jgi:hypothetical protein